MQRLDVVVRGPAPLSTAGGVVARPPMAVASVPWLETASVEAVQRPCQVALWIFVDGASGRTMLHAMAYACVRIQVVGEFSDTATVLINAGGGGGDGQADDDDDDGAATHMGQTATISLPSSLSAATPIAIAAHSIAVRVCQLPYARARHLHCGAYNGASLFLGTEPLALDTMTIESTGPGASNVLVETHPLGASQAGRCSMRADAMCTIVGSGLFVVDTLDVGQVSPHAVVCVPARQITLGSMPAYTRPVSVPPRPVASPSPRAHNAAAIDGTTCVVCYDRAAECTLPKCGHCVLCVQCVTRLHRMAFRCPVCRHGATHATAPLAVLRTLGVVA